MSGTIRTQKNRRLSSHWFLWIMLLLGVLLSGCTASDSYTFKIIVNGSHKFEPGTGFPGDLILLKGDVRLESGAKLAGSIHQLGGKLSISGTVTGDITLLDGEIALLPGAFISGNVNILNGKISGLENANVVGKIVQSQSNERKPTPNQAGRWLTLLIEFLTLPAFAALIVRFLPKPIGLMEQAGTRYALVSAAIGVLAWVTALALIVLMAYTLVLIPISLISFPLLLLVTTYGAVPYALILGRWVMHRLGWEKSRSFQAAFGMILLILLIESFRLIPVIGSLIGLLFLATSFGAALLTKMGFQQFVSENMN